jgi:hypothetical protein
MNNELWGIAGKGKWRYTRHEPNTYRWDEALITCTAAQEWHLFINRHHVGTFNSWEEARDATPMMISLHGYQGL